MRSFGDNLSSDNLSSDDLAPSRREVVTYGAAAAIAAAVTPVSRSPCRRKRRHGLGRCL